MALRLPCKKVSKDLLMASDSGHLYVLLLQDFSAAFDAGNHSILLRRWEDVIVKDQALSWFRRVIQLVMESLSLLFDIYMLAPGDINRRHNIRFHCYVDGISVF